MNSKRHREKQKDHFLLFVFVRSPAIKKERKSERLGKSDFVYNKRETLVSTVLIS